MATAQNDWPPNWMIGSQITTNRQWFVWEPFDDSYVPDKLRHLTGGLPEDTWSYIHSNNYIDSCLIQCLSDYLPRYGFQPWTVPGFGGIPRRPFLLCQPRPACHSGGLDCRPGKRKRLIRQDSLIPSHLKLSQSKGLCFIFSRACLW